MQDIYFSNAVFISVDECMKAWKNLRDRFGKEKNKMSSGSDVVNWPYYEEMMFYKRYYKPRR